MEVTGSSPVSPIHPDPGPGNLPSSRPASSLKWRFLTRYWLVQGPVLYLFFLLFYSLLLTSERPRLDLRALSIPWVHGLAATIALAVSALQAAMVLPIHAPSPTSSRRSRLAKALIGGVASGMMLAAATILVLGLAFPFTGDDPFERALPPMGPIFWIAAAIGTAIATPILLLRFRDRVPLALSMTIAAMLASCIAGTGAFMVQSTANLLGAPSADSMLPILAVFAIAWLAATPVLIVFSRSRDPEDTLCRIAALLFTGTGVELLATIPNDVMIRRRTTCYCAEGTFWAPGFISGVAALVAGPAIFLLPLARRRRRWAEGRCLACGYDLKGLARVERCPECGSGWKPRPPTVPPCDS